LKHRSTLCSLNKLAATLCALGDFIGARELFAQALDAHERLLGPDHPHTRTVAQNLSWVPTRTRRGRAGTTRSIAATVVAFRPTWPLRTPTPLTKSGALQRLALSGNGVEAVQPSEP
jgi:hypothetical protein